ncbi:uncharacterized protein UHOD_11069 [Ustilago sp. UG-2017b]|nr:uncharacterized protein UHOD_11069 [Ustilago sp. UG-2017b]
MEHIAELTLLYEADQTLIDQAKFVTVYNNCIMNLQDNSRGTDYDAICAALFKRKDDMAMKPNHMTNGKITQAFVADRQNTNQDAYSMGKPGPDGRQKCYYCQGECQGSRA